MSKKILVLLGNPDKVSFSGSIADAYESSAREAGYAVDRVNVNDLKFDPILHKGYKEIQPLEPDLILMQEKWRKADHIVIVYPNWWCTMPAVLKGMFDRMYLPGFAFHFDKRTKKCEQLLKGKTARVIVIAGTHSPFMTWLKYGDYTNEIQHAILGFAGIKTRVLTFGPSDRVSDEHKARWIKKVQKLGAKGK